MHIFKVLKLLVIGGSLPILLVALQLHQLLPFFEIFTLQHETFQCQQNIGSTKKNIFF